MLIRSRRSLERVLELIDKLGVADV